MTSLEFGFDLDDFVELAELVFLGETRRIIAWLEVHILSHHDMHALLECLARMIFKIWPMALTKDAALGPRDFWALQTSTVTTGAGPAAAQMITAALNEDWNTLTALIRAVLTQPEEYHGAVTAHLLGALHDGMHAVVDAKAEDRS